MRVLSAPKITRVHTLQRLRTVVNFAHDLASQRRKVVDDIAVAQHLIDTRLSKPTTERLRDQIGRRARDHLESARYLGLLAWKKVDGKHSHFPTAWGDTLSRYSLDNECPYDPHEEAIFVDRFCRLKLANVYYSGGYSHYRCRPGLTMLYSLSKADRMNIYQIGYILSGERCDPARNKGALDKTITKVQSSSFREKYVTSLSAFNRRNIRRDVMPFVDWARQLGLIILDSESGELSLTSRGKRIVQIYSLMIPVWWGDFGLMRELTAASLILIDYLKQRDELLTVKRLCSLRGRSGLFKGKVGPAIKQDTRLTRAQLFDNSVYFDFSLWYDVPPDFWLLVERHITRLLRRLGKTTSAKDVIISQAWQMVHYLEKEFVEEANIASSAASKRLQVKARVRTASIQSQFSSPYEGTTYLLLQQLEQPGFSVFKYQGQLVDFFSDELRWKRFVQTNPDLFLRDGFFTLVECKSTGEWGPKLRLNKKVQGELALYSRFAAAVVATGVSDRCIAVFSYEGEIDKKTEGDIVGYLAKDCPNVVILTRDGLQKAAVDAQSKRMLRALLSGRKTIDRLREQVFGR